MLVNLKFGAVGGAELGEDCPVGARKLGFLRVNRRGWRVEDGALDKECMEVRYG